MSVQDSHSKNNSISRRALLGRLGISAAGVPLIGTGLIGLSEDALWQQEAAKNFDEQKKRSKKLGIGYRQLGRTGMKISEIIVGCGPINPAKARIVETALDSGINYLDTASGYGNGQSERGVGQALKAHGKRDKVIIATKATGLRHRGLEHRSDKEVELAVREKLEGSLKRLGTDYIDVYFIQHGASDPSTVDYPQQWKVVEKLKKEGKIRAVALSTHSRFKETCEAAIACGKYDVLMTIINAATMDKEVAKAAASMPNPRGRRRRRRRGMNAAVDMTSIVKACKKKKIGVIAMKAAQRIYFPGSTWQAGVEAYGKDDKLSDHQVLYRKVLGDDIAGVNIGMNVMKYLDEALALEAALQNVHNASGKKSTQRKRRRG